MAGNPAKILVVDDDQAVRASLARVLSTDGYRVDEACSGIEAVRLVEANDYALVILDLRMPNLGGLTVLQNLRSGHPGVPVIVMTGFASIENAKESIELGAFDFLLKPLGATQIRDVVSRALASGPWMFERRC